VEILFTLDGADLCDKISHLTAAIKITDSQLVDPRIGSPMYTIDDGPSDQLLDNQSQIYCLAMKSLIGKDTKKSLIEVCRLYLIFFENLKKHGLLASELGPEIYPAETWIPHDLAIIRKHLNTGCGACKNGDTHFCHSCACSGIIIVRFLVDENR